MPGPRYRAADEALLIVEPLDIFTAVFHRPSGITHLLNEPAPQILEALADEPLDAAALLDRLAGQYELDAVEGIEMLQARLDELEAAGLVDRL
ncbi:HPr-rel-A system PqqD family peptide chaperone [Sphingomonas sp. CFBP8993]|uniref:HPr-rel-A system PqqD family peptide chaperone n=1 Tax=Sphingomonas sp. CFBP8993 TaxID=3096526 RepID=UPI002A6B8F35|nr:HPr-rel-A system PqqD family peptide chaperone [Sphingomonas sp. CFBP8993]MDY0957332.1 HPr-rel-A system PqqD family peptide chaperone [Sphingomonas sp. CFBP8993]